MARWTIDETTTLDFDGVVALKATLVAGRLSVLAGDKPSVRVTELTGRPIIVTHEAGMLTIDHEVWEGVLGLLRNERSRAEITVTVPRDCPIRINLVSADGVVSGMTARTSIKTGTGDITLDGVTGEIDATTMSGRIEAQGLSGTVSFNSVSGELALAGGSVRKLSARTVGGKVTADIALGKDATVHIATVAGEVALRLPETTSAEVSLNSTTGRIDTAFPQLNRADRTVVKTLNGKLGDGDGRLYVNTVSASVTLLSRPADLALED
jgi:hypothetical protein